MVERVYDIYDDPRFLDRYTIRIDDDTWTMSHNPTSPQGVFMYAGKFDNSLNHGTNVPLGQTPEATQKAIVDLLIEAGVDL